VFSGIDNSLGGLYRLSGAKSRSLSAENPRGEKGRGDLREEGTGALCARDLGRGWKISPSLSLAPGSVTTVADISGSGAIQHIWMTFGRVNGRDVWRDMILRFYWDGAEDPSVEVPAGDFFANGWNVYCHVNSLAVCANPARGFNCYWTMPFLTGARITVENRNPNPVTLYYQIDYVEADPGPDIAYFCASFRRSNPTEGGIHTVIDGIEGRGQYVGTYLAWQVNNNGWWGEGEFKFYIDGDRESPTVCGTGTEDYFCGAYNFDVPGEGYTEFSTPYSGLCQVIKPDGLYRSNPRFGMYRWHITDPVRFETGLCVTVQDLGWRSERRYLVQKSDISSTAFWYQTLPVAKLRGLGSRDDLEII
jgi:hypothetical protein